MYIKNEELFFINNVNEERKKILYIPLRGLMFNIDEEIADRLIANDSDIVEMLYKEIVKQPLVQISDVEKKIDQYPPTISINLSDNCMLRCIYCYMCSCNNEQSKTMTFEEAKTVVDTFIKYAMNTLKMSKIKFSFFGGAEPTFDVNLFKNIIEYIKEQSKELGFTHIFGMTTNGCYNPSLMDYVINNFDNITFSLDGPAMVQNIHRPMLNGKDSFDKVIKTAKKLYNSKLQFSFRVTVSKLTLDNWEEVMDFFIQKFPGTRVYLAPLLPIGRGADEDLKSILPSSWEEVAPKIYDYCKGKINVNFPNVYLPDKIRLNFCGASTAKLWIVSRDGTISTCPHDRLNPIHIIGSFDFVNESFAIDNNKIKLLRERFSVLNYPECSECFCKYTCAGGCPSQKVFGLKPVCDTTKSLTEKAFSDYVSEHN